MTLLVTGGAGNTGTLFLKQLRATGFSDEIRCLVQPGTETVALRDLDLHFYTGDLWQVEDIRPAVQGVDTLVHIAGITMTPTLITLAQQEGIRRLIVVSTTGIYSRFNDLSRQYLAIEQMIFNSGLAYTILRPTMIYGNQRDYNMHKLVVFLNRFPIFPVFGSGANLMQPVYVEDLARAVVQTLYEPKTSGKAYDLPGQEALSYSRIIDIIADLLAKRVCKMHIPIKLALWSGLIYNKISSHPIVSYEQILRLTEDKAYPYDDARSDLDYQPLAFEEGIAREIRELKGAGII